MRPIEAGFLLLSVALTGCGPGAEPEELAAVRAELDRTTRALGEERALRTALESEIVELRRARTVDTTAKHSTLQPHQVDRLRSQGLESPADDLRSSLTEQTQFLPGPSDKALEYHFNSAEAEFLGPHYIWVSFEEGHYLGWMLLEYSVADGVISWEKLWSST